MHFVLGIIDDFRPITQNIPIVKIRSISAFRLQIPLKVKFSQSSNTASASNAILVEITTSEGVKGYGECCPRPYVTGETRQSVIQDITSIGPYIAQRTFHQKEDIQQLITQTLFYQLGNATLSALELALLDAWGKEQDTSLFSILECKPPEKITYRGILPFGNLPSLTAILNRFNFSSIKIKLGKQLEENVKRIQYIQNHCPSNPTIRVDINNGWTLEDAMKQIPILIELGIKSIEAPFSKNQHFDLQLITKKFGKDILIMADESVCTLSNATDLIRNHFGNALNPKVSKMGGLFHAMNIGKLALKEGIPVQIGAHFGETSVLTQAGIILNALLNQVAYQEGGFGRLILKADVCQSSVQMNANGMITANRISRKPGLGLNVELGPLLKCSPELKDYILEMVYSFSKPLKPVFYQKIA